MGLDPTVTETGHGLRAIIDSPPGPPEPLWRSTEVNKTSFLWERLAAAMGAGIASARWLDGARFIELNRHDMASSVARCRVWLELDVEEAYQWLTKSFAWTVPSCTPESPA
jgi:hypothetical protein